MILTVAIVVPVSLFSSFSSLVIGITIAKGCLLCSPSNITGSLRHKVIGLVCAAALAAVSTVLSAYAQVSIVILIPVLALLMFGISYLAVYGLRASLVSFSGLLAVVLSFTKIQSGLEIWQQGLLIFAGGLWYLLLSLLWYSIKPKKETDVLLAEAMQITSDYLRVRKQLLTGRKKRNKLQEKLFSLQTDLNEKHERLRETLISSGNFPGHNDFEENRLMAFVDLVDILELAMTNPVDYEKMDVLLKDKEKQLEALEDLITAMADHLGSLAAYLQYGRRFPANHLNSFLSQFEQSIETFRESMEVNERRESMLLLRNLYSYQKEQVQKINSIFITLGNKNQADNSLVKKGDVLKFLSRQDYSPSILLKNFNFNSTIFRHSLRLAVIVVVGFSIGIYFSIQNAYWILLTIVVIMRPNYGLTKERSKQRIVGTLIGGAIAIGIVFIVQNKIIYTILGIGSLTMAFSLLQRNYRTAAIFITLSIIFIYALMQPNVINVIEYRILDTLIGAALAAMGNYFLWPAWEVHSVKEQLIASLGANKSYLNEIDSHYHIKGELPVSYKLARKHAFICMGNLSAAFQRVTQEPESRQKEIALLFKLVSLNQTFLSALASLGTFIRSNKTTSASESFEKMTGYICRNIEKAEEMLVTSAIPENHNNFIEVDEAKRGLSKSYENLLEIRIKEVEAGKKEIDPELRIKLREAQLVNHQLEWLRDLSENILNAVTKVNNIFNLTGAK